MPGAAIKTQNNEKGKKKMLIKITRRAKLLSIRNEWIAGDYYLINGRAYNPGKTRFYPFKFVLHIDLSCDLWDGERDIPYDEALRDMIFAFCDTLSAASFDDEKAIRAFYDDCNATIEKWNASFKR